MPMQLREWHSKLRDILSRPSLSTRMRLTKADGTRMDKATLGNWGEHLAAQWLRKHGRKVLYRNYRAGGGGEVDIVARHGKMLTFVEVKTRTSTERGRPAQAVNKEKEKLILRGMDGWMRMLKDPQNIPRRCDIVEVVLREGERPEISVLEGALKG